MLLTELQGESCLKFIFNKSLKHWGTSEKRGRRIVEARAVSNSRTTQYAESIKQISWELIEAEESWRLHGSVQICYS